MAKKKTTNKKTKEISLENILFNCRDYLRGKAQMTDKRDLLLTLVFIKFIGDRFNQRREEIVEEVKAHGIDDDFMIQRQLQNPNQYQQEGIFYLSDDCLWDKLIELNASDMALKFDNCITELEQMEVGKDANGKPICPLKNALPEQIFTKTALEAGVLKKVCDEINKIDPKKFKETDLIGRVYEYFLQAFSINADKEEGEFYTPHSIVELIASLIEPYDGTIYDPACGSGGMFVQSLKMIAAHGGNTKAVSVYGQESEPATYRLCKMNLAVRGISYNLGDTNASSFEKDLHKDMKMDYIMANPPFNLKKWADNISSDNLLNDPRWKGYGVPPTSNANYAWILHILNKLNVERGIAGFLLANGALNDSDTLSIRKQLIENDKVEAIIVLPRNMFYSTDISVTLWILNNNKRGGIRNGRMLRNREGEILFVDLRTWNTNIYEKKYVKFSDEQIQKVCDIYHTWQTTEGKYEKPELYYAAHTNEIAEKGYSLVPSQYIKFVDRDTEIDYQTALSQMSAEYKKLLERWEKNKKTMVDSFKVLGYEG